MLYLSRPKEDFTITTTTGYPTEFNKDKLYGMDIVLGFVTGGEDKYYVKDKYGYNIPFTKNEYEEFFETVKE